VIRPDSPTPDGDARDGHARGTAGREDPLEELRSYKARQGRISALTADAISQLWSRYGVGDPPEAGVSPRVGVAPEVDVAELASGRPLVLEIGSGMGAATVAMAAADPSTTILAVEVHTRGVARLMRGAEVAGLTNVRVAACDAVALLGHLPPHSLAGARAFFPDPWPKARHHKRRLIRPSVVALLADRLAPGGFLHLATDWPEYAERMKQVVLADPGFAAEPGSDSGVIERPPARPFTDYERAGIEAGRPSIDLLYRRGPAT
jgi:tRNA (guanine-N7-)-methyltransferase